MKTYLRMKRRFSLCCSLALLLAMIGIPLSVRAEDGRLTIPLHHKHIAECEETVYRTSLVDGVKRSATTHKAPCNCGASCDYYSFYAECSCGLTWYTTGHACDNSKYGPNHGNCSNYSILNTDTTHSHPFRDYVCGQTEESVIETIVVEKDHYLPATSVTLNAYVQGSMESVALSWGNNIQGTTLTVSENGSYPLYITYSENGIEYMTEARVEVDNIDKEPPMIGEVVLSESEFTAEDIRLSIAIEDIYGLPDECISWNGEDYTADREYVITENGVYEVVVRDYAGNKTSQTIEINHIDKAAPQIKGITIQPTPWYEGSATVKVVAEDAGNGNLGSGLSEAAYSWDGGITWTDDNTITLEEPGSINVFVRDKVGNIQEETFEIAHHVRPAYSGGGLNDEVLSEEIESEETEIEETEIDEDSEAIVHPQAEVVFNEQTAETVEEGKEHTQMQIEVVTVEGEEFQTEEDLSVPQTVTEGSAKRPNLTVVFRTACIFLGTGLCVVTGVILFVLFGMCRIYEADGDGKDKFLGSVGVRIQNKGYVTVIDSKVIHRAKSRNLKMKIPAWFVKNAKYRQLRIKIGKQIIEKYVEKEVFFNIQM